jgi:hypothetical protein
MLVLMYIPAEQLGEENDRAEENEMKWDVYYGKRASICTCYCQTDY